MVVRPARPTPSSASEEQGESAGDRAPTPAAGEREGSDIVRAAPAGAGWLDRCIRFGRGMGVAGAILFFWSGAFCLAWLVVPYVLLRERTVNGRRRRIQRIVAASWRWFLRQLERATLYRCAYQGSAPPEGPCVLVSNHPSLLDVTAIISRMPHVCCVVKSGLVRSPLVGGLLRACGHVSAGDGSLMGGAAVLDAVRQRLQEGFAVLIFPEGTRSPQGGLHRFRRGAFEIAQRASVPLVPLFLRCDPPALGKGTPVWRHPRSCPTLTVHIGAALATNDLEPARLCRDIEADFRHRIEIHRSIGEPVS